MFGHACIHCTYRIIQKEEASTAVEGPCKVESLALPAGQFDTVFSERFSYSPTELTYVLIHGCIINTLKELCIITDGCIVVPKFYIELNVTGFDEYILRNQRLLALPLFKGGLFPKIKAALFGFQQNMPGSRPELATQEGEQRRLS